MDRRFLVGERHRAGERAARLDLLVHHDLIDGGPRIELVVTNGNQAYAVDLLEAKIGHRDGARGVFLSIRYVLPCAILEILDLAAVEEVLAGALNKRHGIEVERLGLRHAKVIVLGYLVRRTILGTRGGITVKDGIFAALGRVGSVGHQLGYHRVRVGGERRLLGHIIIQCVDRGRDVRLAHTSLLVVVDVPQLIVVRSFKR